MLTVKIINQDGLENIAETSKAQYSPQHNYISLDEGGMDIPEGAVAYIMNSDGKTIARHCRLKEEKVEPQMIPVTSSVLDDLVKSFGGNWVDGVSQRAISIDGVTFFEDEEAAKNSKYTLKEVMGENGKLRVSVGII